MIVSICSLVWAALTLLRSRKLVDGDAGGPVLDDGGAVLGMLMPRNDDDRQLPEDVSFAAKSETLRAVLARAGIDVAATRALPRLDPVDLTQRGTAITVLVSCWD